MSTASLTLYGIRPPFTDIVHTTTRGHIAEYHIEIAGEFCGILRIPLVNVPACVPILFARLERPIGILHAHGTEWFDASLQYTLPVCVDEFGQIHTIEDLS